MKKGRAVIGRLVAFTALSTALTLPSLAQRAPIEADNGMVVSAHHLASVAGVEIMRQGGNAIDAAVATGFALAVTYPRAGNLGGGGFMMIRTEGGDEVALDFREVAPLAATADMYLDEAGEVRPTASTIGYLANGVPGTVAGLEHAWRHYGSGEISWAAVLEPARQLAQEGFHLSEAGARDLINNRELLKRNEASRAQFLREGDHYRPGELFRQPNLAATLARLQEHGSADFYQGETARLIASDQARGGGLITLADLTQYRVMERAPIRGSYRGYDYITMPPPSSGGVALKQMLTFLERYDVARQQLHSRENIHLLVEAMRRAFRDRAEYLGDPDFAPVPVVELTSERHLTRVWSSYDPTRATPSVALGPSLDAPGESTQTTHFSAVDAAGNMASCTYTLNGLHGNGITVAGAGFLLNNEMDDFTAKVGVKNMFGLIQGEANAIEPGKRPLSSMTPTIVLRDGKPFLTVGSPGGPTIITTVLQVMINVIDHRLPLTLAIDAPRIHQQWLPDHVYHEPFLASPDTLRALEDMGHVFALRRLYPQESAAAARYWGDAEAIMIDTKTGTLLGVSDFRSVDAAPAGF